jgi:hypothetical protein
VERLSFVPSAILAREIAAGWGSIMRTKSLRIAAVGVAGLAVAMACAPQRARAAIVEIIINTDIEAVVGSISFPTLTGSSATGVLFSYDGFSQSDITSISWTIDPSTYAVTALDLNALQGDNPCPNDGMDCSNRTVNLSPALAQAGGTSCSFSGEFGLCEQELGRADITLKPIPEPSTWAMMLIGFAGLGFAGYRQRQKLVGATSV